MTSTSVTETEWQFSALDTRPVARWLQESAPAGYTATFAGEKQLNDTYFDTPTWRVHRAGYTCRHRQKGAAAELTLKSMAEAVGGLRQRTEITDELEPAHDPRTSAGIAGKALRDIAGREEVRELFTLMTRRAAYTLADDTGPIGEIALDTTTIPVGNEDRPVQLSRVEVEVTHLERARPFVDALVAACSLQPAHTSKFQAALIATGQTVALPHKNLGDTGLDPGLTAAQYGYAVLRRHFATLIANEPGTRHGEDPEYLHDMRVASRRIRATMSAFDPYLPVSLRRLRDEMGWLTRSLGEVRDLDVQLERLAEWRHQLPQVPPRALDALESLLLQQRERARKRMLAALNSRRASNLIDRFATALKNGPPRTNAAGRVPVTSVAPALLRKRHRRLTRAGKAISPASPPTDYHALRIQGKKLRYALEFFTPIYGKPAQELSQRVTALQDLLGLHQDADVAIEYLGDLARENARRLPPETLIAVGMIIERYRLHAGELRAQFPGTFEPVTGKPWKALQKALGPSIPAIANP